jgi:hypothetical protein
MAEASKWISVGALGAAFERNSNVLPPSTGLAGRRFQLHFEDGSLVEHDFASPTRLERVVRDAGRAGAAPIGGAATYSATEIRPSFYFVSFPEQQQRATMSTLLMDLSAGVCTLVVGQLPSRQQTGKPLLRRVADREELTDVTVVFRAGAIDAPCLPATPHHAVTRDLVGKRIEYTYSASERYEHIYLNDRLYTWHCLAGSEQGLADTDRCHYRKLADNLYCFVWREKIVPTLGVVVIDLEQLKTTGRIVGYEDFEFGALTSFAVGARVRILGGS